MHEESLENMKILQYGPPRCGTTMLWQILNYLFEGKIKKTHEFINTDKPIISIYRDFRDSYVSFCRIFNINNDNIDKSIMSSKFSEYKKRIDILNKYKSHYKNKDNILWIKYEDIIDDFDLLLDKIELFLKMEVSDKQRKEIKEKFSRKKNKEISNKLKSEGKNFFQGFEKDSLIHSGHIHTGNHNSWKELVSKNNHEYLESLFAKDLKKWKYI